MLVVIYKRLKPEEVIMDELLWDRPEPELLLGDVPVFDRARLGDTVDVSVLFDDPEQGS